METTNKETLPDIVENDFSREEKRYFVPLSSISQVVKDIDQLCAKNGYQKETHPHSITRSIYYYPGDIDSLPLGFSVRYREYNDYKLEVGGKPGKEDGFMEAKWYLPSSNNKHIIKRKVRFANSFYKTITIRKITLLIKKRNKQGLISKNSVQEWEEYLGNNFEINKKNRKDIKLNPWIVTEYQRTRYKKSFGEHKNIVNIDKNCTFYILEKNKSRKIKFIKLGEINGVIIENKEEDKDHLFNNMFYHKITYRNGTESYGKKNECFNMLQRYRFSLAQKTHDEIAGYEIEGKIDLSLNLVQAMNTMKELYDYFDNSKNSLVFKIDPKFPYVNSQTTMSTYFLIDKEKPESEVKLLVGYDAKFSEKSIVKHGKNGIIIRKENKGERFEFNRKRIASKARNLTKIGKILRTRHAFCVFHPLSKRIYKVCLDYNWKLPFRNNGFFCQLESEYVGVIGNESIQNGTIPKRLSGIEKELSFLMKDIVKFIKKSGVDFQFGKRKVDMLA